MKIAHPGVVVAGNDPAGFVHEVDILFDQLADFFHNLLGTALGDFHFWFLRDKGFLFSSIEPTL